MRRNYARPTEKGEKSRKSREAATDYITDKLLRLKLTSDNGRGRRERWRVREWLRLFHSKLPGRKLSYLLRSLKSKKAQVVGLHAPQRRLL